MNARQRRVVGIVFAVVAGLAMLAWLFEVPRPW